MAEHLIIFDESVTNYPQHLKKATSEGFDSVIVPIDICRLPIPPKDTAMVGTEKDFAYPDLLLTPDEWNQKVVLLYSDPIDIESPIPMIRKRAEERLRLEIAWAIHLQYGGITMIRLFSDKNTNLARILCSKMKGPLWIQVPLFNVKSCQAQFRSDIDVNNDLDKPENDSWLWWHKLHSACDYNSRLRVVLRLHDGDLPSNDCIRRWLGESVDALSIPMSLFIFNKDKVKLSPLWYDVITIFFSRRINVILEGEFDDYEKFKSCSKLINDLRNKTQNKHYLNAYEDVLEIPLQPLFDNLDSYTYDVFEMDPVKYKFYQNAIEKALIDRVPEDDSKNCQIVMVLGAGRGPLVRAVINASKLTNRKVRIFVIEKNPNAIRTLKCMINKLWNNIEISLIDKDMREYTPTEYADIIVSELLGSFGDNELSPECLDAAMKLLKDNGISIPKSSCSYINPIMSSRVYTNVRSLERSEFYSRHKKITYNSAVEGVYVCLLSNVYNIAEPQPLFEFSHEKTMKIPKTTEIAKSSDHSESNEIFVVSKFPDFDEFAEPIQCAELTKFVELSKSATSAEPTEVDNTRYKTLKFEVDMDCVMHGFAGYFDTTLYGEIKLSIHPLEHTAGMHSWFPMFFSISTPIELKKGEIVELHFWRCVSSIKVWYEWCLVQPIQTHVHNFDGSSFAMLLG